jgi:hypothetical protein
MFRRLLHVLIALPLLAAAPAFAQGLAWPQLFDPFVVRSFDLRMTQADWDIIRFDTTNTLKIDATLSMDGSEPVAVQVRRKSSRALPSELDPRKIGLKVDITGVPLWNGVKKLSLENGADSGPVKEGVAWALQQLASPAGYHAGLAAWANVQVTTEFGVDRLGVYVNNEQRDKQFLRNRGLFVSSSTWMYKQDDIGLMEHDVAPSDDPTSALYDSPAFKALCWSPFQPVSTNTKKGAPKPTCVAPASDAALESALDGWIDMDAMLRQGAVDTLTDNGDALFTNGKNYFVVDFATERGLKRLYYPWDLDGVFRNTKAGIYGTVGARNKVTQTPFQSVILNHPVMRARYNATLTALLDGPLSMPNLHAFLTAAEAAVNPHLQNDPYHNASMGDFGTLASWLHSRQSQIRAQVTANGPPAPRPAY